MESDVGQLTDDVASDAARHAGVDPDTFVALLHLARESSHALRREGFAEQVNDLIDSIALAD